VAERRHITEIDGWLVEIEKSEHGGLRVTVLQPTKQGLLAAREQPCSEARMLSVVFETH